MTRLTFERLGRRLRRRRRDLRDRFAGHAVSTRGTDCDGMRWETLSFHWTRRAAQAAEEDMYVNGEGVGYCAILSGRVARRFGLSDWADDRDRFAERMNY